jgi:UDP-N-acetylmuramyl pentapeptide phosphotransferase/UDP-N-acetylglucosamine-1-phosphate transferase
MGTPPAMAAQLQFFVASCVVIFFLGLKDDILIISASKKFIGQIIAAGIIIKFGGVHINNMHGFLGIYEIPAFAGTLFTFLTIIVITNSFNLIDGVDGLAGSLGLMTTLTFGTYFYVAGELTFAVMAFSLAGSLISFLIYNFSPAKIFMGDTGSLLLGLINSILVIKFINIAGASGASVPVSSSPAIGFAILMIPLFDTLRVFGLRILDRRSPFSPDRNHVHHFLLDLGFSHKKVAMTCVATNIIFIILAVGLRSWGPTAVIGFLLVSGASIISIVYYLRQKRKQRLVEYEESQELVMHHKILSLVPESVETE